MTERRSDLRRLVLVLEGRVQGVGYRIYVSGRAGRWPSITGYVRNTADGKVEVVAEGPPDDLRQFAAEAAKGPPGSFVLNARMEWTEAAGAFRRFEVRI
jgi:acylphosphatase